MTKRNLDDEDDFKMTEFEKIIDGHLTYCLLMVIMWILAFGLGVAIGRALW